MERGEDTEPAVSISHLPFKGRGGRLGKDTDNTYEDFCALKIRVEIG